MKKKILFKLEDIGTWGDKCIVIPYINFIIENLGHIEYEYYLSTDKFHNRTLNGNKNWYCYEPSKEPVDYFSNLICPSLNILSYYDKASNYGDVTLLNHEYYRIVDFSEYDKTFNTDNKWYVYNFSKDVKQFTYRIKENLYNDDVKKIDEKLALTQNIIIYATWDDNMVYEHNQHSNNRLRGSMLPSDKFENMKNFILKIDDICTKNNKYGIILISKKAQGWSNILKSDFLDLREFEKFNLTFSQAFYVAIKNSIADIGQWCTFQELLSFDNKLKHIVYKDNISWNNGQYNGTINPNLNHFSIDGSNNDEFIKSLI